MRNMLALRRVFDEVRTKSMIAPRYVEKRPINHRDVHTHYTDESQAHHFCIPDPVQARNIYESEKELPVWGSDLIRHLSKAVCSADRAVSRQALIELMVTAAYAIEDIEVDVQQN